MKTLPFGGFQAGILDDPSNDAQGGFEFASGMDIFSEPGVLKACNAMAEVTYGTGANPTDVPSYMVDTTDNAGIRAYISVGAKILESTNGTTWNLFRTNSNGSNLGLGIWAGYVIYPSATNIGRTLVGDASAANDSYIATLDSDTEFHPVIKQGGTLKIGAGRYIASLDEAFTFTSRAMKLPSDYRIRCLAEYLTNLFMGTRVGAATGGVTVPDSSVFSWDGIVLSSGSALPNVPYPMKFRGMNALLFDGRRLYAFPDRQGNVLIFDGVGFVDYRKNFPIQAANGSLIVSPGGVCQHSDETILFTGESDVLPGVYQMKDGVFCQSFVPSVMTPGSIQHINIGFVKSSFNGTVFIGYYNPGDSTYHIEKSTSNKQNGAMVKTVWHRARIGRRYPTDQFKRWGGIKLNLKPLLPGCSVKVEYRTDRDASFTDPGITIDSTNQNKPAIFAAHPRSREIQFRLTYTTNGVSTPELMGYDILFEVLNTIR